MSRLLRTALIMLAAFAFTLVASWAESRHPSSPDIFLFPGVWITFAIYVVLHLDFLGTSPIPNFLIMAFNTLLYSALIGLLLKLWRHRPIMHD